MKLTSRKARRDSQLDLPMTSMIDVVFLLLIFFMTTSGFIKTERELDPAIKVEKQAARSGNDLEPAIVDVQHGLAGFVYRLGGRELTTADELTALLQQFPNKSDGAFVRVHDEAPFDMAATAIQASKTAGFLKVSYVPAGEKK